MRTESCPCTDSSGSPSPSAPARTRRQPARPRRSPHAAIFAAADAPNADNATALALALSQKPDAVDIELAAAALFDSGNYELIRVTDPEGKLIVERIADGGDHGNRWFIRRFRSRRAREAQISSGWKQVGVVRPRQPQPLRHRALWESTLDMIVALALPARSAAISARLSCAAFKRPLDAGDRAGAGHLRAGASSPSRNPAFRS